MQTIKLEAQKRALNENASDLIKSGYIPAVIYGPHLKENKLVKIKSVVLEKIASQAGESTLIDLSIDGKMEGKILIKDEQRDTVKDNLIHVDFYEVDMNKEITAKIPLHFIGESKAIKESGGVLIRSINEIEVKCLPSQLVSSIEADISSLNNFDDVIRIHDLKLPEGVKLTHETDDVIANIAAPKAEEVFVNAAEVEAAKIAADNAEAEKKAAEKAQAEKEAK